MAQAEVHQHTMEDVAPDGRVMMDMYNLIKSTPIGTLGTGATEKRDVPEANRDNADDVADVISDDLKTLIVNKKRFLFGVTFTEIATESLLHLATARKVGAPHEIVRDIVFSIFVAYTVARDWYLEYATLHTSSILRHFEIEGRVVDKSDPDYAKNSWVNQSKMNATACHLLGYLAVETAAANGTLGKLRAEKGTPFSDLKAQTEQGIIISELAKTISNNDRDALSKFREEFQIIIAAVDILFGATGFNLDDALARAKKFKPAEF